MQSPKLIHLADCNLSYNRTKYTKHFPEDGNQEIWLCYPSGVRERFLLLSAKFEEKKQEYVILDDIANTARQMSKHSRGQRIRDRHDELVEAWEQKDLQTFCATIDTINRELQIFPRDPIVSRDTELIHHLFNQLYNQCVLPDKDMLTLKASSSRDLVYGEMTPAFLSRVFAETKLAQNSVFLDLGSGVGNTVLQAALECGAESWGVEMREELHEIAEKQNRQFHARLKLWDMRCYRTPQLLCGNFLELPELEKVIGRAGVVLCNNFKSEQETVQALHDKLACLMKRGAVVISTQPLRPVGRARKRRCPAAGTARPDEVFEIRMLPYDEGEMSWASLLPRRSSHSRMDCIFY